MWPGVAWSAGAPVQALEATPQPGEEVHRLAFGEPFRQVRADLADVEPDVDIVLPFSEHWERVDRRLAGAVARDLIPEKWDSLK